ncbi:MAG TPA: DUF5615 family PIN-like protein [Blastocatellia bacterium]|nr:DUF5615 family PIN-like protein [Blastocatellia bacterium]
MKIRFQADSDLNYDIVKALLRREPTVDFQSALAAGLYGMSDADVLAVAARDGRILVSHDNRTMPGHFAELVGHGDSAGVIIVPQKMPVADAAEELLLIWAASDSEEWVNRISRLPL